MRFGAYESTIPYRAFNRQISVYHDEQGSITAIESFWEYGGLPLRKLQNWHEDLSGEYPVHGLEIRVGPILMKQTSELLSISLSSCKDVPLKDWEMRHDSQADITVWFSSLKAKGGWPVPGIGGRAECQMLAGIAVPFAKTIAMFPIKELAISTCDLK